MPKSLSAVTVILVRFTALKSVLKPLVRCNVVRQESVIKKHIKAGSNTPPVNTVIVNGNKKKKK